MIVFLVCESLMIFVGMKLDFVFKCASSEYKYRDHVCSVSTFERVIHVIQIDSFVVPVVIISAIS